MPRINTNENNSNIIKIEPNPLRRSAVKVKMQVVSTSGGDATYTKDEFGNKKYQFKEKDVKNMSRLPGTHVEYTAAITKNGLNTGLTDYVSNPFKDEDFYTSKEWEALLKGKDKVRLQEMLEYKHNKPRGYYTNQVSGIRPSDKMEDAPFYQRPESRVSLNDGVTYLDLSNPINEVNYYMLKAHNLIGNSYEDCTLNPDITHYIVNPQERVKLETNSIRRKNKFASRLEEIMDIDNMTIYDFAKVLRLPKLKNDKGEVYADIESFVNKDDEAYDEFMNFYDMWKDAARREVFKGYVELYDLCAVPGLISVRGNKLYWNQPMGKGGKRETWEWKTRDEFVHKFLLAPEYQEEVDILRAEYKAKTRFETF